LVRVRVKNRTPMFAIAALKLPRIPMASGVDFAWFWYHCRDAVKVL